MVRILRVLSSWNARQTAACAIAVVFVGSLAPLILVPFSLFHPNETQVFYLASAGAQVIAALYGLTVAGYSFFISRFGPVAGDDNFDTYAEIERAYHVELILLSVCCTIAILFQLANIVGIEGGRFEPIRAYFLNSAGFWFVMALIMIVSFVVEVVDPRQASKYSKAAQVAVDGPDAEVGSLSKFLADYNEAEQILSDAAKREVPGRGEIHGMMQALGRLRDAGKIPLDLYGKLNDLRVYRNYAVHSFGEQGVSREANDRMAEVLEIVKQVYQE